MHSRSLQNENLKLKRNQMKKFLLTAALAATFSYASADAYTDAFTVNIGDRIINNGETVDVDQYYDEIYMLYPEDGPQGEFDAVIHPVVNNISSEAQDVSIALTRTSPEITDEFPAMGSPLGFFQLCFKLSSGQENCLNIKNNVCSISNLEIPTGGNMVLDVDQKSFTDLTPVTLKLDIKILGEENPFTVYFNFTHKTDITLGVEGIEAEKAAPVYYNMQGCKVNSPVKGEIYIVRKGLKSYKQVY